MMAENRRIEMLKGIRVVEMASYVAAPSAGGIMADWGAEVIRSSLWAVIRSASSSRP